MPAKEKNLMKVYINERIKVIMADGALVTGILLAFDTNLNLLLSQWNEYIVSKRRSENPKIRARPGKGILLIRGQQIVSITFHNCSPENPIPPELKVQLVVSAKNTETKPSDSSDKSGFLDDSSTDLLVNSFLPNNNCSTQRKNLFASSKISNVSTEGTSRRVLSGPNYENSESLDLNFKQTSKICEISYENKSSTSQKNAIFDGMNVLCRERSPNKRRNLPHIISTTETQNISMGHSFTAPQNFPTRATQNMSTRNLQSMSSRIPQHNIAENLQNYMQTGIQGMSGNITDDMSQNMMTGFPNILAESVQHMMRGTQDMSTRVLEDMSNNTMTGNLQNISTTMSQMSIRNLDDMVTQMADDILTESLQNMWNRVP